VAEAVAGVVEQAEVGVGSVVVEQEVAQAAAVAGQAAEVEGPVEVEVVGQVEVEQEAVGQVGVAGQVAEVEVARADVLAWGTAGTADTVDKADTVERAGQTSADSIPWFRVVTGHVGAAIGRVRGVR
jgi:hypothetical protein